MLPSGLCRKVSTPVKKRPNLPHPAADPGLSGGGGASAGGTLQRMAERNGFSVERSILSTRPTVAGGGLSEPGWSRRRLRFGGLGGHYSGWLNGTDFPWSAASLRHGLRLQEVAWVSRGGLGGGCVFLVVGGDYSGWLNGTDGGGLAQNRLNGDNQVLYHKAEFYEVWR